MANGMKTITELCLEYGSDKCPNGGLQPGWGHSYAPFYDEIFKDKKDAKTVLELGAGSLYVMKDYVKNYRACASLRVWRDFFVDAEVYGLDNKPDCDIQEERIRVLIGDQSNPADLQKLVDMAGGGFDIIIDDCSHRIEDQLFSAHYLMGYLKDGGIYCIEDIREPEVNFDRIKKEFSNYRCETHEFTPKRNDCLAVIWKND